MDASRQPEYGVLCFWDEGHVVRYFARRPVVSDNFGDDVGAENLRLGEEYFSATSEARAREILNGLQVRYVVVRGGPLGERTMGERLQHGVGLGRHRLIFESPARGDPLPVPAGAYRVFELVQGVELVGRAPPGSQVTALLAYRAGDGRSMAYGNRSVADGQGRYRMRLPYATDAMNGSVETDSSYRLAVAGRESRVVVGEEDVLEGNELVGPDFWP
jgi:asparagine N-glycosylation enzyme membrane subunit Stt3